MRTPAEENYLKALWHLGGSQAEVPIQALVQRMGASSGAITDMLKRLAEKGYIIYRPYHGVKLTERGRTVALEMVRRHRIWETFVYEKLGYTGQRIHELAEELEHACDEEFIERLYGFLGQPKLDPHGDEIPALDKGPRPLSRLNKGQKGVIRCWSSNPSVNAGVALLGFMPGEIVKVLDHFPCDQALWVEYQGRLWVVPPTIAENLWVDIV
ncbi:MAG: metal-dependent transcriptional regulator [Bacteroidia bacterium]|nr:metal-dependent transcriptional regulator [Bacteroidia bacterium]MDW8088651.1 metal-dependent transcriptional regulator [Bacteroidia bacterium]